MQKFQYSTYKNSLQKFLKLIYAKMYQTPQTTPSHIYIFWNISGCRLF